MVARVPIALSSQRGSLLASLLRRISPGDNRGIVFGIRKHVAFVLLGLSRIWTNLDPNSESHDEGTFHPARAYWKMVM